MEPDIRTIKTSSNQITWYVEQCGSGPDLVLVPSGEGDCYPFRPLLAALQKSFRVTTFDTPGLSRSVPAPQEEISNVSGSVLARQIISLCDELNIEIATFYGCSSGGAAVLALQAEYPERVRNAIVHEVPMAEMLSFFGEVMSFSANEEDRFGQKGLDNIAEKLVGNRAAWDALGSEYHARVMKNLRVWEAGYIPHVPIEASKLILGPEDAMKRKPINWSIGAWSPAGLFIENVKASLRLGLPLEVLKCKHFPQLTIPEDLAQYLARVTNKYL